MTFTIPVWVLWVAGIFIGVPLMIFVLFLIFLGFIFLKCITGWRL